MRILGIDPGASGAFALFDTNNHELIIIDMPIVLQKRNKIMKRHTSAPDVAAQLKPFKIDQAICEKVGAMPGQGVSSMFAFGRAVGVVEGVLAGLGVPVSFVIPQVWQRALALEGGKNGARLLAAQTFPNYAKEFSRVKDNGRADAALIALYGSRNI